MTTGAQDFMNYDLIVVGGGVTGSSLSARMATAGARVLLLERDTRFKDRIRGESLQPWGVAEVRRLGVADPLSQCATEVSHFDQILNGERIMHRELKTTTACGEPIWDFYHPDAQEMLIKHAESTGVDVRRGVSVTQIIPGKHPKVSLTGEQFSARMVALCVGRNPAFRADLGFDARRGSIPYFLSGVWLDYVAADVDPSVAYVANDVRTGSVAGLFPQHGKRARAYFGYHPDSCFRLQGEADYPRFRDLFTSTGGSGLPFGEPKQAGPLASFECTDVWVDHPYQDGVALLGDAAASNDPSWGQGLSLSFRDARTLSDELLASSDWNEAGYRYAGRHDHDYGAVSSVTGWFHEMFQSVGPAASARRSRALPLIGQDPTRVPDVLFSGPDFPLKADSYARFFGDDLHSAAATS